MWYVFWESKSWYEAVVDDIGVWAFCILHTDAVVSRETSTTALVKTASRTASYRRAAVIGYYFEPGFYFACEVISVLVVPTVLGLVCISGYEIIRHDLQLPKHARSSSISDSANVYL